MGFTTEDEYLIKFSSVSIKREEDCRSKTFPDQG